MNIKPDEIAGKIAVNVIVDEVSDISEKALNDAKAEVEKTDKKLLEKATQNVPKLYQDVTLEQMEQIAHLMQQPMKAIDRCITKEQLRVLCKQMLIQNLRLQQQLALAKN